MDFFDIVKMRRSVRSFTKAAIEAVDALQILEAANASPSAGNLQAYEIYVVTNPSRRKELAVAALQQNFIADAPLVMVFCAHPARCEATYGQRGVRLYSVQDATIACCFAMLAATDLGLGSVWVGAFDDEAVRRTIGAPSGLLPVAILPIGYAAEAPAPTSRRHLGQLVHQVDSTTRFG